MIQRLDPLKGRTCGQNKYFVCNTDNKGSCYKNGVNYLVTCMGCKNLGQKREYNGKTSRNAYTRGKGNLDEYQNRAAKSVL